MRVLPHHLKRSAGADGTAGGAHGVDAAGMGEREEMGSNTLTIVFQLILRIHNCHVKGIEARQAYCIAAYGPHGFFLPGTGAKCWLGCGYVG